MWIYPISIPFNIKQKRALSFGNVVGMTGTQISLRKTNMQQLVGELLNAHGNQTQTEAILDFVQGISIGTIGRFGGSTRSRIHL